MPPDSTWDVLFTTNDHQADFFLSRVLALVKEHHGRPSCVLDVGCGDGGKVMRLAECWPDAVFTGVDIAEPNIRAAERLRQGHPAAERLQFHAADYTAFATGGFD